MPSSPAPTPQLLCIAVFLPYSPPSASRIGLDRLILGFEIHRHGRSPTPTLARILCSKGSHRSFSRTPPSSPSGAPLHTSSGSSSHIDVVRLTQLQISSIGLKNRARSPPPRDVHWNDPRPAAHCGPDLLGSITSRRSSTPSSSPFAEVRPPLVLPSSCCNHWASYTVSLVAATVECSAKA